jgi:hypothetical protein
VECPAELADLLAYGRRAKAKAVAAHVADGAIRFVVDFKRAGRRIARVATAQGDSDELLDVVRKGVPAMAADTVCLLTDALMGKGPPGAANVNPYTGRPYRHGDLQRAVVEDGALGAGRIAELLMLMYCRRDGTGCTVAAPYIHDRAARTLVWDDGLGVASMAEVDEIAARLGEDPGRYPEVVRAAFAGPTVMDQAQVDWREMGLPADAIDLEVMQAQADVTWCLLLADDGCHIIDGPKGKPLVPGEIARKCGRHERAKR